MKFSNVTLEYFVTVVQEAGFSQAADKLGKSQSVLSTQIGLLEKELNLKLLDRSKRPVSVTEAGKLFFNFATEILNKSEDFERYLSELATGVGGEVRIGASTSIGNYILPQIVRSLVRTFPKLKLTVLTQPRSATFDAVRRGEVDFALVLSDIPPDELSYLVLRTERLCVIISPRHKFAEKRRIVLSDLGNVPFILGPKGTEYTEMITRILAKNGCPHYKVAARISNFEGVKELVRAGLGITLLPDFVVRREFRQHVLTELRVGALEANANIMNIERAQHLSTPTMLRVQNILTSTIARLGGNGRQAVNGAKSGATNRGTST